MNVAPDPRDRDAVLAAFLEACPGADPAEVLAWRTRYPHLEAEILELAGEMILEPSPSTFAELSEAEAEEDHWAALAKLRALEMPRRSPASLHDLMLQAGTDVPALARRIGVARDVVSELEAGHVWLPIGPRMMHALADALRQPMEAIADGLANSYHAPQLGYAKAEGAPTFERTSWRDLVLDSGMPDDRKAYWLDRPTDAP